MAITELVNINIDLVLVGLSVAGIALLGFLVYFNNQGSATNQIFLAFAMLTVLWGISNYFEYRFTTIPATLWALRVHLFISTWHAFLFFAFCYIFPHEKRTFPKWFTRALIPIVVGTSLLTLSPYVFTHINQLAPAGEVTNPERGPGLLVFSMVAFGLLFSGLYILFLKWRRAVPAEKSQNALVLFGMSFTALLILCFNVFLPVILHTLTFIPLAALFILPLIASIGYAIMRYHLFRTKVVTAQLFSFLLCIATLVQVLFSASIYELIFRTAAFALVLVLAILFVRSVYKEVEQRETIEKQEKELEQINSQQESLLHFISHEIKGYLTKGQNAFAGIVEGDYGETPPKVKALAIGALHEMRKGVSTVMDILDASNYKKGTMTFAKEPFDIKKTVLELADELRFMAEEKGLQLDINFAPSGDYSAVGDEAKIRRHVFRNLIENSIRYTPKGKVIVALSKTDRGIRFAVSDTGVGITEEDKKRLFTQGGRGKDSVRVNVNSTGYGLFVAKQVVEAHGGKIAAYSEGPGKGSTFSVELPIAPNLAFINRKDA
jgi:signal transduction histidine kinase